MATSSSTFTPEQEQEMIEQAYRRLLQGYLNSNHRRKVEIIEKAYHFAAEAHKDARRRSGEPYIMHPIAVATIVSQEIGLGSTSICAALLHDVVEDTEFTTEDIERQFGPKIAQIVDGLTKISGGMFGEHASEQAENYRKLLLTMTTDIRVILIKMADRLHNMRTLDSMPTQKQYKVAGETLYIYAPLAHRLGLFSIKTELEDLSFKYEHQEAYADIESQLAKSSVKRSEDFARFAAPIRESLDAMGLTYEFHARVKSCYSIWKKMQAKHVPLEEVYDLYAARIVFDCPEDRNEDDVCWEIFRKIVAVYHRHPDRLRDWLEHPKANGYRALHLTVMGPDGNWVEVQIRSRKMDDIAERGFAAHWKYKIGEGEEEAQLWVWLKTIEDILKNPEPNALDFLDTIRLNLFASEISVFTPNGDLMTLPKGSTVLDFAYSLHTELGNTCIAGKVNHQLVPVSQELTSGDQVEIITSKSQHPKEGWLRFVHTGKARSRLRAALRHSRRLVIDRGEQMLKELMQAHQMELTSERLSRLIRLTRTHNKEDLYYQIGAKEIVIADDRIKQIDKREGNRFTRLVRNAFRRKNGQPADETPKGEKVDPKKVYVLRGQGAESNYVLADCCHPIPGDDVLGYVNEANVVTVHKIDCSTATRLKNLDGRHLVETRWDEADVGKFPASIHVEGIDRLGILQEIIYIISTNMAINMRALNIRADRGVFSCDLDVLIADVGVVNSLCKRLKRVKGVTSATRNNG